MMRQEEFIDVMLSVCMATREEAVVMLDRPARELSLDSLDFELLRTALEKRLNRSIDDVLWEKSPNLRHLMESL